ncbi:WD repeat-containing protein 97 [Anolis sagrei]|uniref:WD repeat-containing protein 97 n=1 Tax=Anolis sagrei TaxID=38937 RepID=UPI0035205004
MVELSEPSSAQVGPRKRLHSQAHMEEKKEKDGEEDKESPDEARPPPDGQKGRARQLWRMLQKGFRHAVEKMKTEEMKVAYLSHGLQHLSHLVLDSPVRYVTHDPLRGLFMALDSENKLHFLREDGSLKGSARTPVPMMGLLYAAEVDQFVSWDAGGMHVLDARLQPLSQVPSAWPIHCGLYCQELNRIVMAGERTLTLWDFRYGHRSLHCCRSIDLGSEDTITHLVLDATSAKAPRCFVSYSTGVAAFDISKGRLLSSKRNLHSRAITGITYCDVTGCIATASRDTTIKVWDDNWHIQTIFVGHTAPVIAVTFYPERPLIFSASQDGTIRTWNLSTTDQVDQVHTSEPVETLETLSVSRVASRSGRLLNLWKINQLYSLYTPLGSPLRRLTCVNLEAVGDFPTRAICICQDSSVRLVDVQSGLVLSSFTVEPPFRAKEAAYCLPRETLFVLTEQGALLRINTATDPMVLKKNIPNQDPQSKPCCLLLYSHIVDPGTVFATWLQVKEDKNYRKQWLKQPLRLQDKNRFLPITGHQDGLLSVLEWFSGRIQCQVKAHSPKAVTALAEYPTQTCVISAGNDRTVKMWRLFPYTEECLVPLLSFSCGAPATHMCSFGPTLAVAFQDPQTVTHRIVYYNLMEQSRLEHGPEEDAQDDITGLCYCPNLKLFASSSRDGSVKIWNMKNQMLRQLKLNTIPEGLAFANHWGDLLVGIERHLYLIHHSKYLPNYYKMKLLCAKFLEPLQDACLPLSDACFQTLVQENTRRLLHEPPLEESESPLPGAHRPVTRQESKVTIGIPARRQGSRQLATRDQDLERLQSGRASPAKKVRITKEMKDEAFEQYLKIFYKEPFKVEIPEEDTFNADEVLEAMRYVTSLSDLYGPGNMFLGCFPRPEVLKTVGQISMEAPLVVPETQEGRPSLAPRALKDEKEGRPSQADPSHASPSHAAPSQGAPSRISSSQGAPQILLSDTTVSRTESTSEAREAQAREQVDIMMKEMFYKEKDLLPLLHDSTMRSPPPFKAQKKATPVDPKAVAQGLLITTKDSKEGMTKPLRTKYESHLDVITETKPKPLEPPVPLVPPVPPVPLVPPVPPVSEPSAPPVPRSPSTKSGKIIVFKEPSSIAFKEPQSTAIASREKQRSFSPVGSTVSPQRSGSRSPSRMKSHSSEIIKGFFPERPSSSAQWKDMPLPLKSHQSMPLPRIASGFVPNSVVSQQLHSQEELEAMRRRKEEEEEDEERIMEITGPMEEGPLDRSFFWSPPEVTSPPVEPEEPPVQPRTPKSLSFKEKAPAVFLTQLDESQYKDRRKEPPFFIQPFLEHEWFKALFPEGFPPDMTVNEFLTILLSSLVKVDFGTKADLVSAIARLRETLQGQMKDVIYKTVLYVLNKGEEDPSSMDRDQRKFILSALRMLLNLDKDKEELMVELMTYYVISPPAFRVAVKDLIQDVGVQDPHNYFFKEMESWPVKEGDTRASVRRMSGQWLTARMQELKDHRNSLLKQEALLEWGSSSELFEESTQQPSRGKVDLQEWPERMFSPESYEEEEEEEEEESDGVTDQAEGSETEQEVSESYEKVEMSDDTIEKKLPRKRRPSEREKAKRAALQWAQTVRPVDAIHYFMEKELEKELAALKTLFAPLPSEESSPKNTVVALPSLHKKRAILRLGETNAMLRKRMPERCFFFPYIFPRYVMKGFAPFVKLPLPKVTLDPFPPLVRPQRPVSPKTFTTVQQMVRKYFIPKLSYADSYP